MASYIIKRIGRAVVVLLFVSLIVFGLLKLLPGGTARAILGPRASPGAIMAFNRENGFDQPLLAQYGHWLWKLAHWNLGYSYHYNRNVASLLSTFLPKTLLLVGTSTLLAVIIAIPLGLLQASRAGKPSDHLIGGAEMAFYSMPTFFLGILLILYLAVDHHIFPSEAPQGSSVGQVLQHPRAMVLPVLTLTLITVALFARYMRSSAIDVLFQDHVRTAVAKGAGTGRVMRVHVLRNAVIPVVTLIGLSLPTIVGGAVVTESIFNYPGMGLAFWTAAQTRDFAVLLGFTMVTGIATVVGSLFADIAYAVLDPRVRLH